ncbi:class I SAM-dependent methyltransferase [Streptomyces sp. NA02950]|uniref:class I SAM-dependent methyltransferase n=1 Tax=Streptomyces sp. NA02950 TaxID=2742137 RepID=UPI0020CAEF04|nr:class I SAM-dependent methyltransferase [Streptomyces sp. NA02950]
MTPTTAVGVALRAKQLDDWTTEFLAEHQKATVLHLACGLDTRVQRLDPPSSVHWDRRRLPGRRRAAPTAAHGAVGRLREGRLLGDRRGVAA